MRRLGGAAAAEQISLLPLLFMMAAATVSKRELAVHPRRRKAPATACVVTVATAGTTLLAQSLPCCCRCSPDKRGYVEPRDVMPQRCREERSGESPAAFGGVAMTPRGRGSSFVFSEESLRVYSGKRGSSSAGEVRAAIQLVPKDEGFIGNGDLLFNSCIKLIYKCMYLYIK